MMPTNSAGGSEADAAAGIGGRLGDVGLQREGGVASEAGEPVGSW